MSTENVNKIIRMYALQNAVQFNGKADPKAVTGKVIAATRSTGISPKDVLPRIRSIVEDVNRLSADEQYAELSQLAPDLLVKEKKTRDFSLPPLPSAEEGKVVTRFPPEPNGFLHIGHAKAAVIDHEYARLYKGKFILRFDDTNPEKEKKEFYDVQKEDLSWLGITWDKEYNTSDNLETHYTLAEQLITQGDAYLCSCPAESIKKGRFEGTSCSCRDTQPGVILDQWKAMCCSGEHTGSILRLRGNLQSKNTAMRDPTLFRVIEAPHPLTGTRYRVWPTYDFAGAVEDSLSGVTHPFRTKEYELRDEVYFHLLSVLHLRKPCLMEFARLSIEGMPVSKRKIKPLIENGQVPDYDDVRLPTLRGLQRRGIIPEAIKQFVLSQGISKVESDVSFSIVEAGNRKLLDPQVKRFFFVPNPIELTVGKTKPRVVRLKLHPTADLGEREIQTDSMFFISQDDTKKLKVGEVFRLKDLMNVKLIKKGKNLVGEYMGDAPQPGINKIQWTPKKCTPLTVYVPGLLYINDVFNPNSLTQVRGCVEEAVTTLKSGEIVQFERFGFVRLEQSKNNELIGFFAHK